MTATVLGSHQLAPLLFLFLAAPGTQLGARATTDCTSGFISLDRLRALSTEVHVRIPTQTVYPNINFTCNGAITKLTVMARRHSENNRTMYPEFQVWRRNNADGVYTRVGGTALSDQEMSETDWEIYEQTLDPPLEFQAGDVFGMFLPKASRLLVAFDRSDGPESLTVNTGSAVVPPETFDSTKIFTDTLLVAITADHQECVRGSASLEKVEAVTRGSNGSVDILFNRQSVSPQIKFTCDGNITKWIVGANWNSNNNRYLYPELQVWRRANESIPNSYHRVGNTTIAVEMENINSHVYEYPVDPPLPVKAGDVLGVYQPARNLAKLRVLYEIDSGPVSLYQTPRSEEDFPEPAEETVRSHSSLPLVTVEMVANPTDTISASIVITETPGGGVNTNMPASFPVHIVGTGVTVGVVAAIAALAAIVIVMVLVHNSKKRKCPEPTNREGGEVESGEARVESPSISSMVEIEARGTAESAQPMEIHGNEPSQTAAEAIVIEQNAAYREGIDHTHFTSVVYEEISGPQCAGEEMESSEVCLALSPSNSSMEINSIYGMTELIANSAYQRAAEVDETNHTHIAMRVECEDIVDCIFE